MYHILILTINLPAEKSTGSFNYLFSHGWFATPQEVLHADWHDVWHSPQPPSQFVKFLVLIVFILLIRTYSF